MADEVQAALQVEIPRPMILFRHAEMIAWDALGAEPGFEKLERRRARTLALTARQKADVQVRRVVVDEVRIRGVLLDVPADPLLEVRPRRIGRAPGVQFPDGRQPIPVHPMHMAPGVGRGDQVAEDPAIVLGDPAPGRIVDEVGGGIVMAKDIGIRDHRRRILAAIRRPVADVVNVGEIRKRCRPDFHKRSATSRGVRGPAMDAARQ